MSKPESMIQQAERRRHPRNEHPVPAGGNRGGGAGIRVRRTIPVIPIADAQVINTSRGGVAIRTRVPLHVGDRLSFAAVAGTPPILAEVLACEPLEDGDFQGYRVRCRCLLGGFEAA